MPTAPIEWQELVDSCSATNSTRRTRHRNGRISFDVHDLAVVISGRTTATVVPSATMNPRFGFVVQARKGVSDEEFWRFDTDEHLERFEQLVRRGEVHRVIGEGP